jgi:hypothetical protein
MTLRVDYSQPQQGDTGFARTNKTYGRRVTLLAADLVTTNTVAAFKLPPGFVAMSLYAGASDMDTNGSPTLTISVGDASSAARFLSASTIGQAGTATSTVATTGFLFQTTAETTVIVSFPAASATAVAGTLDLYITGFII